MNPKRLPHILGRAPEQFHRPTAKKEKKRRHPPPPESKRNEPLRGWYACCGAFYEGYGCRRLPSCPKCGKKARQALMGEVYDEHG